MHAAEAWPRRSGVASNRACGHASHSDVCPRSCATRVAASCWNCKIQWLFAGWSLCNVHVCHTWLLKSHAADPLLCICCLHHQYDDYCLPTSSRLYVPPSNKSRQSVTCCSKQDMWSCLYAGHKFERRQCESQRKIAPGMRVVSYTLRL